MCYLACLSFLCVEHVEEERELTGEAELFVADVVEQLAAQRLNKIQNLK